MPGVVKMLFIGYKSRDSVATSLQIIMSYSKHTKVFLLSGPKTIWKCKFGVTRDMALTPVHATPILQ